ncbi:MAG: hypothetical protein AAF629_37335 [Chloroflexota bacterium]
MMQNPYLDDNKIKLRVTLTCDRKTAWHYIGTPEGYAAWFPATCTGTIVKGETIDCTWWWSGSEVETYHILDVQDQQYVEINWEHVAAEAKVRYTLEGNNPAVFYLEATYAKSEVGREAQLLDIAPWSFATLNLKSVAAGGVDLRNHRTIESDQGAFLD